MGNFCRSFAIILAVGAAGCGLTDATPPPLQGPSELGLSLTLFANPDVLSQDGASQAQIVIESRDANGQVAPNTPVRVEIMYQGTSVDFGTLSSRSVVTGSNGRATVTYTAPTIVGGAAAGTVNIMVTPTGNNAANAIGRVVDIRLVPPGVIVAGGPTPSFTFSPTTPRAFEDVVFVSDSTPAPATDLTSWSWNFGDGSTGSGQTVIHRFASGTYTVQLTVTDTNGLSATDVDSVTVGAGNLPTASFTISPPSGNVNDPIFFNGSGSTPGLGRRIVRYRWTFGNGATASGSAVSHSYDTAGTFNVTLTVTDDVGQTDQQTSQVIVSNSGPVVVITTSPASPNPGTTVNFNSDGTTYTSGSGPGAFAWTFGDGGSCSTALPAGCGVGGTPANPTHVYLAVGSYSVRLSVTDDRGRTGTGTATVTVGAVTPPTPPAPPIAAFTFSPPNPSLAAGGVVSFDAATSTTPSGAAINNYRWNFGDGTIISGAPGTPAPPPGGTMEAPRHTYLAQGSYTVTLIITDTNNQTGTASLTVTVGP